MFIVVVFMSFFKKRFKQGKCLGILFLFLFYVLLSLFFIFIIFYGIQFFYQFVLDFKDNYDLYLLPMIKSLFQIFQPYGIDYFLSQGQQIIDNFFIWLIDGCLYCLSFIPSFLSSYFFLIISSFLFYLGYDDLKNYLLTYLSDDYLQLILNIKNTILLTTKSYFFTQCQLMAIVFIFLSIGFMIIRLDYPILLSIITAFLDALPFIGVGIILLPMTLFYLVIKDYLKAIYILILYALINMTRTFLEPKLMKNQLKIPVILLFVSMIIHLQLFGFIGLLISPITLSFLQSLLDNYKQLQ